MRWVDRPTGKQQQNVDKRLHIRRVISTRSYRLLARLPDGVFPYLGKQSPILLLFYATFYVFIVHFIRRYEVGGGGYFAQPHPASGGSLSHSINHYF